MSPNNKMTCFLTPWAEGLSFSVKKQANQVKQKTQPTQNRSPVEGLNQKKEIYRIGFGKDDSK